MIPFTDLQSQYQDARQDIDAAIARVIKENSFITGPLVEEVEESLIKYTGAEACASCGSGTTALQIALMACGVGPSDEVITVSHTFVSTPEAVVNCGATPVFCDIDEYYHMDLDQVEGLITPQTKAILWVDTYGQTPDIERLAELAKKHNLYTIADAAHSFGYSYKNKRVGTLADLTCVSFNPVKNLGAMGDAGCVLGRADLIERAKMFRNHGRNTRFDYEYIGINARIDNMQAVVVQAKLKHFDRWVTRKREIAKYYSNNLSNQFQVPLERSWGDHSFYVYVIETDKRDALQKHLYDKGIQTNIHYANPCHTTQAFSPWYRKLPETERRVDRILSIPLYFSLTDSQIDHIVDSLRNF